MVTPENCLVPSAFSHGKVEMLTSMHLVGKKWMVLLSSIYFSVDETL